MKLRAGLDSNLGSVSNSLRDTGQAFLHGIVEIVRILQFLCMRCDRGSWYTGQISGS